MPRKGVRIDCPQCGWFPVQQLAVLVEGKPEKVELTCKDCGHSYISRSRRTWREAQRLYEQGKVKT